jgi:hypothetical protein
VSDVVCLALTPATLVFINFLPFTVLYPTTHCKLTFETGLAPGKAGGYADNGGSLNVVQESKMETGKALTKDVFIYGNEVGI